MKKYIFPFFILISLSAIKCVKERQKEENLPPISSEGANTFGCRVDGKVWLPHSSFSFPVKLGVDYFIDKLDLAPYFGIVAIKHTADEKTRLTFDLKDLKDTGVYQIGSHSDSHVYFSEDNTGYDVSPATTYIYISRFDTLAKIISGTFSFVGKSDTSSHINRVVNVTDGRFDFHYPIKVY